MTKFSYIEEERPVLYAELHGTEGHDEIVGEVFIYHLTHGLCLCATFSKLPPSQNLPFHIHEGTSCDNAGGHIFEFPDIMSDKNGEAYAHYYFDKYSVSELAGKAIMLHIKVDGEEPAIACGVLKRVL